MECVCVRVYSIFFFALATKLGQRSFVLNRASVLYCVRVHAYIVLQCVRELLTKVDILRI